MLCAKVPTQLGSCFWSILTGCAAFAWTTNTDGQWRLELAHVRTPAVQLHPSACIWLLSPPLRSTEPIMCAGTGQPPKFRRSGLACARLALRSHACTCTLQMWAKLAAAGRRRGPRHASLHQSLGRAQRSRSPHLSVSELPTGLQSARGCA